MILSQKVGGIDLKFPDIKPFTSTRSKAERVLDCVRVLQTQMSELAILISSLDNSDLTQLRWLMRHGRGKPHGGITFPGFSTVQSLAVFLRTPTD